MVLVYSMFTRVLSRPGFLYRDFGIPVGIGISIPSPSIPAHPGMFRDYYVPTCIRKVPPYVRKVLLYVRNLAKNPAIKVVPGTKIPGFLISELSREIPVPDPAPSFPGGNSHHPPGTGRDKTLIVSQHKDE